MSILPGAPALAALILKSAVSYDTQKIKNGVLMSGDSRDTASNDPLRVLLDCCRRSDRRAEWLSSGDWAVWAPHTVLCPNTKRPFTCDGAWRAIAEAIDTGAAVRAVKFDRPPDSSGFSLLLDGFAGMSIYVELQLANGIVLGRCFHLRTLR